jgi:hypothetical protein
MRQIPEIWIYFVQRADGDIKIGSTRKDRIKRRFAQLWKKHGVMRLLGLVDARQYSEVELHARFIAYRKSVTCRVPNPYREVYTDAPTEFFAPDETILNFIRANSVDLTPFRGTVEKWAKFDYFADMGLPSE